jgi:hypothetical protein
MIKRTMQQPAIWCPDADSGPVARPAHCYHTTPQDLPTGPSGTPGTLWASLPLDQISGEWRATPDGWWLNVSGVRTPGALVRMRMVDGLVVRSRTPGHAWVVPQLLRWNLAAGTITAIPSVWQDFARIPADDLADLLDRLRAAVQERPPIGMPTERTMHLAAELLALNYHTSLHELSALGWLDAEVVTQIVYGAAGWYSMKQQLDTVTTAKGAGNGR